MLEKHLPASSAVHHLHLLSPFQAVLLSQLDSVRRELLEVIEVNFPRVTFGKEAVREVLAFAAAGEDTPRSLPSPQANSAQRSHNHHQQQDTSAKSKPSASFARTYDNDLWDWGQHNNGAMEAPRPRRYAPNYTKSLQITDEDIYGPNPDAPPKSNAAYRSGRAPEPSSAGGSGLATPGNSSYGGVLRIRDMLTRAEQGLSAVAEAQEQRRSAPPKIFGSDADSVHNGGAEWDAVSLGADVATPPNGISEFAGEEGSLWGGVGGATPIPPSTRGALSISDWAIRAEPTQRGTEALPALDSPSGKVSSGVPGLVGKLAGLAFVLGSIAAATAVATGALGTPGSNAKKAATDLPPWKDGHRNGARRTSSSGSSGQRRRASTGKSGSGSRPGGSRAQRESGSQAPVMHVHQPPPTGSFPANPPPDVTAAMG